MWAGSVATLFGILLLVGLVGGAMWGCPQYNVYQQGLAGEAELSRAEQNRQITVEKAKATVAAAEHLADAEVIRARGVSEANEIIAEGLGGPQGYLRYLWIQQLGENDNDVIYIPTEAGMPILEATRGLQR